MKPPTDKECRESYDGGYAWGVNLDTRYPKPIHDKTLAREWENGRRDGESNREDEEGTR